LQATLQNIQEEQPELLSICMHALLKTIPFTGDCFRLPEQREFLMEHLFKAAAIEEPECQRLACECLVELPAIAYEHLLPYLQQIGALTYNLIQRENPEALKQALMFWDALCAEESRRGQDSLRYITQFLASILPLIFSCIEKSDLDEEDGKEVGDTVDD